MADLSLTDHYSSVSMLDRFSEVMILFVPSASPHRVSMQEITACTVVQAVVKATSQSNGKGQILTPPGGRGGAPKPLKGFR